MNNIHLLPKGQEDLHILKRFVPEAAQIAKAAQFRRLSSTGGEDGQAIAWLGEGGLKLPEVQIKALSLLNLEVLYRICVDTNPLGERSAWPKGSGS